jgi:hypothetical protein
MLTILLRRLRTTFCLLLIAGLASPAAQCANFEPGGQGTMRSAFYKDSCFTPEHGVVQEVCAQYKITWKLWSLMGEPVGDYRLAWKLDSIKLMDPQRKQVARYTVTTLPKELEKAASRIELYIDGSASVNGFSLSHRFNTGVAVRANAGSSMNTPGSPNWDALFAQGVAACKVGAFDVPIVYLPGKEAKAVFAKGVMLDNVRLCGDSGVSELSAIEGAIGTLCAAPGSDKRYLFCPTKKAEEKKPESADAIDDAFAALDKTAGKATTSNKAITGSKAGSIADGFATMETEMAEQARARVAAAKLRAENEARKRKRQARHDEAVQFCQAALKSSKQCIEDACNGEPSEITCLRMESAGASCNNCIMLPVCAQRGPNPAYSEWASCARRVAAQCRHDDRLPPTQEACVSQREQAAVPEAAESTLD